jgi:hypothetical protein
VEENLYKPLIIYGQIILKKNLDLEIEEWMIPHKKIMLLHFIQRKEENSKEISGKHLKSKVPPSLVSQAVTGVNCHLVELTSQLVFS